MKKKDAKLPQPKKLKLDQYEMLATLGTGISLKKDFRLIRKSQTSKRDKDEKELCSEDPKES